eukprot:SAG11_NODE_458_length_9290_cov_2.641388_2_plen_111_part_00
MTFLVGLSWLASLTRVHDPPFLGVLVVVAVDALDAVRCADTEVKRVWLLAWRAQEAAHTIGAEPPWRTDQAAIVLGVRCAPSLASLTRHARGTRPSLRDLLKVIGVVVPC